MTNQPETQVAPEEPVVWQLVPEHETMLDIMADGMALIRSKIPPSAYETAPPDIAASEFPEVATVANSVRRLAELLIADLTIPDESTSRDVERAETVQFITDAVRDARLRVSRSRREDALADVGELIRETGLEFHDLDLTLATAPDGTEVLVAQRLPVPVVYASLIGRLIERAESLAASDPYLALDRDASNWFFSRWSNGESDDPELSETSRMIREQEWSLVSRDTMALDEPVIASFAGDDADDVPPRQRHLADAYMRSTVGIFEVTDVDGPIVTVRDVIDGETRRYFGGTEEAEAFRGLLVLGRLIPIAEELWLPSPAAVYISSPDEMFGDMLAESLTRLGEELPIPIALEALLSIAVYNAPVPVPVLPAPTVAEAQAATMAATQQLVDLGLLEDVPQGEAPPDVLEQIDSSGLATVGLGVDQTIAEWLAALFEQASLDDATRQRATSKKKKQKHKRAKSHPRKRPRH